MFSPSFLELLSVRYLILPQAQTIPGFHVAVPQTTTTLENPALLLERDNVVPYARVMLNAAKSPEGPRIATLLDPRFPLNDVALFADTSSVRVDSLVHQFRGRR